MAEVTPQSSLIPGANVQSGADPATTQAVQRNSMALSAVSNQIANISTQMNAMNMSLQKVHQTIAQNTFLEQQREYQKQQQERLLAEQRIREGKEGIIEQKMQSALMAPVNRIAGVAQNVLGRLGSFLQWVLGGWLGKQALDAMSASASKNEGLMNQVRNNLKNNLFGVLGIFAVATIGIGAVTGMLLKLSWKIGALAIGGLIVRPLGRLLNFFGSAATKALGLKAPTAAAAGLSKTNIPRGLAAGTGKVATKAPWWQRFLGKVAGPLTAGLEVGSSLQEGRSVTESGMRGGGAWGGMAAGAKIGASLGSFGGPIGIGIGGFLGGFGGALAGPEAMSGLYGMFGGQPGETQTQQQGQVQPQNQVIPNWMQMHPDALGETQTQQQVQPQVPPPQQQEGNRGFLGWRSSLDWMTGGLTDFDEKGSEGNLFNPISGGRDGKWGAEPVEQQPINIVQSPPTTVTYNPNGSSNNNPATVTPHIMTNNKDNLYALASQMNYNVVAV